MTNYQIPVTRTQAPKAKAPSDTLGFGRYFTDHMFVVSYSKQKGWYDPKVIPYQALQMDPGASVLHYGQALFEGMKAFYQDNGRCVMFRPEFNWQRMNEGAERLCMP